MKINYKIEGKGKTIILLHGWQKGASMKSLKQLAKHLQDKNFKVIRIDLPGFGKSEKSPNTWGIEEYASEIANFIKKHVSDKYYIVGHSFGGAIAGYIAGNLKPKPEKLILIASSGIREKGVKLRLINILAKVINALFEILPVKLRFKLKKLIYFHILHERDYIESIETGKKSQYLKIITTDLSDVFEKIKLPTLLVWGDRDKNTPLSQAKKIHKLINNSKLYVITGAKHGIIKTHDSKVSELIADFVNN